MSKYFYCPFPKHDDKTLKDTRRYYRTYTELQTCYDPVLNRHIPERQKGLSMVKPGDTVYLNAHGLESTSDTIEASHLLKKSKWLCGTDERECKQMTAADLARQMVEYDGLADGTETSPIYIKCLICFAGGGYLNRQTENLIIQGGEARNKVLEGGRGRFAHLLAGELKKKGLSHLFVGGYPGEVIAEPKKVKSQWPDEESDMNVYTTLSKRHAAAWFDTDGRLYYKAGKNQLHPI